MPRGAFCNLSGNSNVVPFWARYVFIVFRSNLLPKKELHMTLQEATGRLKAPHVLRYDARRDPVASSGGIL